MPPMSSMEPDADARCRVAVVGSGMAGLVTAYLLNQDPKRRYQVEVFEIVRSWISIYFPTWTLWC